MAQEVEIFKHASSGNVVLEITTTNAYSSPNKDDTHKSSEVKTETEEFPSVDNLANTNRDRRFWSGVGMAIGSAVGAGVALKIAEQFIQSYTGTYHGNTFVDAGADLAGVLGSIVAFESSRRGFVKEGRVTSKLKQLTQQGLNATIPTRS